MCNRQSDREGQVAPPPLPARPDTPPFQRAITVISIPSFLLALGAGMITPSFWGGIAIMILSVPVFWGMLCYSFNDTPRRLAGIAASLVMCGIMIWLVWSPASIDISLDYEQGNYPPGKPVLGIPWRDNYSAIWLTLA